MTAPLPPSAQGATPEQLERFYVEMLRTRRFEERCLDRRRRDVVAAVRAQTASLR